jgi:DNA transposition AAA+ family ATPase
MVIEQEFKKRVVSAMLARREMFAGSDAKFATSLGISSAIYSRVKNGETEKVLNDSAWVTLGRQMNVSVKNEPEWVTVKTPVFAYITTQLKMCQSESVSAMLCDMADVGKTYSAKHYVKTHRNAIYVDCSQVKSKQKLIRYIAKEFGVDHSGKYHNVYEDLVYYIRSIESPMIVLDEAGDLDYSAFLELKALWNATERACGWYMMGADGLKEKVRRAIECKKVGYTEIFSRYGKRYGKITPDGKGENDIFIRTQAAMIIKANAPEADARSLIAKTDGSLRRIFTEIKKVVKE